MKKLKQFNLLLATLFILLFSVASQSFSTSKVGYQNKEQNQSLSFFLDDDLDDGAGTEETSLFYPLPNPSFYIPLSTLPPAILAPAAHSPFRAIPPYLRIQNLRI